MPSGPKKRKAAKKKKELEDNHFKDYDASATDDHTPQTKLEEESNDESSRVDAVESKISSDVDDKVVVNVVYVSDEQPLQEDDHHVEEMTMLLNGIIKSKSSGNSEQIERLKRIVVQELDATDKTRAFLQKVLDDLNTIHLN